MKLLITGGCGFIGSNIAEYFLENKLFEFITIVDNLSSGFIGNICDWMWNKILVPIYLLSLLGNIAGSPVIFICFTTPSSTSLLAEKSNYSSVSAFLK